MRVTWLAQGGLLFELRSGVNIMVDPYLFDYQGERQTPPLHRLVPAQPRFADIRADILILTHDHTDHADPYTLERIFGRGEPRHLFCSSSVWEHTRGERPRECNAVILWPGCEFTLEDGVRFCGVRAHHSDPAAIGVWFEAEGVRVYISGDTIFGADIAAEVAGRTDIAFLCVNGMGNNMNAVDAARLARLIAPSVAVPVHWDLLPGYTADPRGFQRELDGAPARCRILREFVPYALEGSGASLTLTEAE